MKLNKHIERLGVAFGILGAFSVAGEYPAMGYPLFTLSSVALLYTAWRQGQINFIPLQTVYLGANILGLVNYM